MKFLKKHVEIETLKGMSLEEINEVFNMLHNENKMLKEIINSKNTISDNDISEIVSFVKNELPHNGEWWSNGEEDFIEVSKDLLAKGYDVESIKEIFNKLYYAVASEYE